MEARGRGATIAGKQRQRGVRNGRQRKPDAGARRGRRCRGPRCRARGAGGARRAEAIPGPATFRGPENGPALAPLLERATAGAVRRFAFAVPAAITWPLPLYELALLTAEYLTGHATRGVEVALVTPEDRPLALFGAEASDAIRELLELR